MENENYSQSNSAVPPSVGGAVPPTAPGAVPPPVGGAVPPTAPGAVPPPVGGAVPPQPGYYAPQGAPYGAPQQPQYAAQQPQQQSTAPQVGLTVQKLDCPNCRNPLGPKDIISSSWAYCRYCKESVRLNGGNSDFDDNVLIERLAKFTVTKEKYHEYFMQWLMEHGDIDIFDNLKVVSIKRKYFWAREYGQAKERAIFPMCKYGRDFFERLCDTPYMLLEDYETHFNTQEMVNFNSDDIRDTEVIAREQSASENRYEFSHTDIGSYPPTPVYYCLPVVEEVVEYNGQEYTFIGTASGDNWWFNLGGIPTAELFHEQPKYTSMKPVTWIVMGVIALILIGIVIAAFNNSFWSGVITLVILGILGYFLGVLLYGLIYLITGSIDAIIRAIVNRIIRKKFRNRWTEFQEHKRQSAQSNLHLNLTYEVPEFPVP